jgi:hypothetical protein
MEQARVKRRRHGALAGLELRSLDKPMRFKALASWICKSREGKQKYN